MSLLRNIFKRFTRQSSGNVAAVKRDYRQKAVCSALFLNIESYLLESQRYLDKDISRATLACELETNVTYIARAIRDGAGMTVNEYIRSFRIDHAHHLLSDPLNITNVSKIAKDCGFNNRTSFYRGFVARYGVSPNEYRERVILKELRENKGS